MKIKSSKNVSVLDNSLISAIADETVKLKEDSVISFEDAFRKAKKKYGVE